MSREFSSTFLPKNPSHPSKSSIEELGSAGGTFEDVQQGNSFPVVMKAAGHSGVHGEKKENSIEDQNSIDKLPPPFCGGEGNGASFEGIQTPVAPPPIDKKMSMKEKRSVPALDTAKMFGVKSEYLGMEIQRRPPSTGNGKGKEVYNCKVIALSKDSTLDMYSYHRGREGFELRDPYSGKLKCPTPQTDTSHSLDAPRVELKVVVEFPLQHDREVTTQSTSVYRETLDWDLSDPKTPSPAVFANQIASEFGLSFGQMMDLAISIESQIAQHMQQNCNFCVPLSVLDPVGNERRLGGQAIRGYRFDQILRVPEGGARTKSKDKHRSISRAPLATGQLPSAKKKRLDEPNIDDIDEIFVDEIKRRGRSESTLGIAGNCQNGIIGLMERKADAYCHLCRNRIEHVFIFACGNTGHAYCEKHCKVSHSTDSGSGKHAYLTFCLQQRLEEGFNPEIPVSSFCPMCSMNCACTRCIKKARTVACDFKMTMDAQGTSLEDTNYDGLITKGRNLATKVGAGKRKCGSNVSGDDDQNMVGGKSSNKSKATKRSAQPNVSRTDEKSHLMVTKPPLTDFPREIVGAVEVDRATTMDYLTVYTSNGNYIADTFPEAWVDESGLSTEVVESVPSGVEAVEDGNVDYCQICRSHGNLVCCDYCPRAYHMECIESKYRPTSDARWECMVCEREKEGLEDDLIDAEKSMDTIVAAFTRNEINVDTEAKEIKAMSAIYLMILKLLDYDFGYMFAKPVDIDSVPGYRDFVKHPMDLGTITKKLTNGDYAKMLKAPSSDDETGTSLDVPLIALLKEIELVWHNCLLFNFDGSAVYRMAAVQRRRALSIRKKSFEHLLSDHVKVAVKEYVLSCENARVRVGAQQAAEAAIVSAKEKEFRAQKPKGKHKITTKAVKPKVNKPVAILDSSTGRIVKTYASLKSAYHAALCMVDLGHRCEQFPSYDQIKSGIQKSATDTSLRFFGYRWIFLDNLKEGQVALHKIPYDGFQVYHEDHTFTYASMDEAASFLDWSCDDSAAKLLQKLSNLEHGCEWTNIFGSMWRRLRTPALHKSDSEKRDEVVSPPKTFCEELEKDIFASCSVVKKDVITGRILTGYSSNEAAYSDWKKLMGKSPLSPRTVDKSVEFFNMNFLNGDANIDGLAWNSQQATRVDPPVRRTEDASSITALSSCVPMSPLVPSARRHDKPQLDNDCGENADAETRSHREDEALLRGVVPMDSSPQGCSAPMVAIELFKHPPSTPNSSALGGSQ